MKNILFISPTGGYAGIDVSLDTLVSGLNRNEFNPVVVFPLESKLKDEFEKNNIKCYSLPLRWWFPIGFSGNDLLEVLPGMRDVVEPLVQIIKDNKIDIVLSNTSVALDGAIAASIANTPHILFMHAKFEDNIYVNMPENVKKFVYELIGKLSVKVVCCSRLLHEFMINYVDNSTYIYNGVILDKFTFNRRALDNNATLNMVCVGHYNANKQQDFVLKSLHIIKSKNIELYKRVHFTMIGPGEEDYIKYLKNLAKELKIDSKVTFEGYRDNINQVLEYYNLYINSSKTENLPISVIEAMASGVPVLGNINDGTTQLIDDGVTGFLVHTPEELAYKIIHILENPTLLEDMSKASRDHIEKYFSDKQFLNHFETLFNEIGRMSNDKKSTFSFDFYNSLTYPKRNLYPKIKVLVIYPKEANATYYISAKYPLDFLRDKGFLEYEAIELQNLSKINIKNFDLVFCIRLFHDEIHNLLELSHQNKKPFIWYIDDNYFALKFTDGKVTHTKTQNKIYEKMFKKASAVIVNNGELYHVANKLRSNAYRLPTYQLIDYNQDPNKSEKQIIRFGFMGTKMRDGDFEYVVPALERITEEFKPLVEIEFIGYYPESLIQNENVKYFDFISDYNEFRQFFKDRNWDFAIAPLNDTEFNRSKTNNKYREYSSYGIPGVYSDISVYNQCVSDGFNGLLVDNSATGWYEGIKKLITDSALRLEMGKCAFADIQSNYKIDDYAFKLLDVFINSFYTKEGLMVDSFNYKPRRYFSSGDLCFSGPLYQARKYNIRCQTDEFSQISMLFASEHGGCKGNLTVQLLQGNKILRVIPMEMQKIEYHRWTTFTFENISNYRGKYITINLIPEYDEDSPKLGVFEDRKRRKFWYKVFNKLGRPLKGKDALFVDFNS